MQINKIQSRIMLGVYLADLYLEIAYIYYMFMIERPDGVAETFFTVTCGAMTLIDIILIWSEIRGKKVFARMPLLIVFAVLQFGNLAADIPLNITNGAFWDDGYIYFALEWLFIVIYTGRYFMLRAEKRFREEVLANDGE